MENCKGQSSVKLRSSGQVVVLLLPNSSGDSRLFPPPCVSWSPGSGKVGWLFGMAFCVDVIIVGLRKACAVRNVVSEDLLW